MICDVRNYFGGAQASEEACRPEEEEDEEGEEEEEEEEEGEVRRGRDRGPQTYAYILAYTYPCICI